MMLNQRNGTAESCAMAPRTQPKRPPLKVFGLIVGAGAVVAAAAFTLAQPDQQINQGNVFDGHGALVASGNHNATFTPPNVPGMNMGATVVSTTPAEVLPVEKAVPQVKAGH